MSFYDDYDEIESAVTSGELSRDQLSDLGQIVLAVGRGEMSYGDLSEAGKKLWMEGGLGTSGPTIIDDIKHQFKSAFGTMQSGARDLLNVSPIADYVTSAIAEGTLSPTVTRRQPLPPDQQLYSMLSGPAKLLFGSLGIIGAPGAGTADTVQREAGLPTWSRVPLDIGLGIGASGVAGAVGRGTGMIPKVTGLPADVEFAMQRLARQVRGEANAPIARMQPPDVPPRQLDMFQTDRVLPGVADQRVFQAQALIPNTGVEDALRASQPSMGANDVPSIQTEMFPTHITEAVWPSKPIFTRTPKTTEISGEVWDSLTPTQQRQLNQIIDAFDKSGGLNPKTKVRLYDPDTNTHKVVQIEQTVKSRLAGREAGAVVPAHDIAETVGHQLDLLGAPPTLKSLDDIPNVGRSSVIDNPMVTLKETVEKGRGPINLEDLPVAEQLVLDPTNYARETKIYLDQLNALKPKPGYVPLKPEPGYLPEVVAGTTMVDSAVDKTAPLYQRIMNGVTNFGKNVTTGLISNTPGWRGVGETLTQVDRAVQAMRTTAIVTGMRNMSQSLFRAGVQVPTTMLTNNLLGRPIEGISSAWNEVAATIGHANVRKYLKEAGRFNESFNQALRTGIYGEASLADNSLLRTFGSINRLGEDYTFLRGFDAKLRTILGEYGLDYKMVLPSQIPKEALDLAVKHGQEAASSRNFTGELGKLYQEAERLPVVGHLIRNVAPYARFNFANAFKDFMDMTPVGMLKAMASPDPVVQANAMAKSFLGMQLINGAAAAKRDPDGEWYHIRETNGELVDMRRWHPYDVLLMIGELINRPPGSPGYRLTPRDYIGALTGIDRVEGSIIDNVLNVFRQRTGKAITEGMIESAGNWISAWTTPARTVGSITQIFSPEERIQRDVRQGKGTWQALLDPTRRNIPFASQSLPARISPLREDPPSTKSPLASLIGADVSDINALEREFLRLKTNERDLIKNAYGTEGSTQANRVLNEYMGKSGTVILNAIRESQGYKAQPNRVKRELMYKVTNDLQSAYRKAIAEGATIEEATDYAIMYLEKKKGPTFRMLMELMGKKVEAPDDEEVEEE